MYTELFFRFYRIVLNNSGDKHETIFFTRTTLVSNPGSATGVLGCQTNHVPVFMSLEFAGYLRIIEFLEVYKLSFYKNWTGYAFFLVEF